LEVAKPPFCNVHFQTDWVFSYVNSESTTIVINTTILSEIQQKLKLNCRNIVSISVLIRSNVKSEQILSLNWFKYSIVRSFRSFSYKTLFTESQIEVFEYFSLGNIN
jgi:hypothetical protein